MFSIRLYALKKMEVQAFLHPVKYLDMLTTVDTEG